MDDSAQEQHQAMAEQGITLQQILSYSFEHVVVCLLRIERYFLHCFDLIEGFLTAAQMCQRCHVLVRPHCSIMTMVKTPDKTRD